MERWLVATCLQQSRRLSNDALSIICYRKGSAATPYRARVEHPFHVTKNLFHHRKTRYRGLVKASCVQPVWPSMPKIACWLCAANLPRRGQTGTDPWRKKSPRHRCSGDFYGKVVVERVSGGCCDIHRVFGQCPFGAEGDVAVCQGKQGVIAAQANVVTRV